MKKPTLIIMAAGMGSRYGGLKQIDPVDEYGNIIMDYSIYDAKRAGFEEVVFIIKKENEEVFQEAIGNRISQFMTVRYAFQELTNLPRGYSVPDGRSKPFGTGQAVLSAKDLVSGPFVVINADDYYGVNAFKLAYEFLIKEQNDNKYHFSMVGYLLKNTVTDNGYVSRGVCTLNQNSELVSITERTRIEKRNEKIAYTLDEGKTYHGLDADTLVSMNMWGFSYDMMVELENRYPKFLDEELPKNPMKCEYFLPSVVSELLEENSASVEVLPTSDKWYGITYKEDKPMVEAAIKQLKKEGIYKERLW
ncbi:MAG: NDP-sugar synthase [Suipraeoptans sp.]